MQEEVGQQGQVKLPPAERGLVLAGGRAGASSACRLRGGQLNRLGGLYGKPTMCQASAGLSYTTCGRWKPVRTPGQQGPHSSLPASTLPSFTPCHVTCQWAGRSIFIGLYSCGSLHSQNSPLSLPLEPRIFMPGCLHGPPQLDGPPHSGPHSGLHPPACSGLCLGSGNHLHSGPPSSWDLSLLVPVSPSGSHIEPDHGEGTSSIDKRTSEWLLHTAWVCPGRMVWSGCKR